MAESSELKNKKMRNKHVQSGFSVMELIVVLVVMMIVLAAVFSLMRGTIITANSNYEMTAAGQGLRNGQEFITRDALVVGDGFKGVSNIWLPTAFVTNYLTARTAATLDPANAGFVSVGAVVSDDNVPAGKSVLNTNPATTVLPASDRITMLAVDPSFSPIPLPGGSADPATGEITIPGGDTSDFAVGEIYHLAGGGNGSFGAITAISGGNIVWQQGDAFGLNYSGGTGNIGTATGGDGSEPATLTRVNIVHYFVDASGKLVRRAFGVKGAPFVDSVVAEHVTNLQFQYTLQPDVNGTIYNTPIAQVDLDKAAMVRMVRSSVEVETANELYDGQKHRVEGITEIGVRNLQFEQAPVPYDPQGNTTLPNPGPTPYMTPLPSPSPTPSPTPATTPTPTPSPTPSGSPAPTPAPSPAPTPAPTATPPPTPTPSPTPSTGEGTLN